MQCKNPTKNANVGLNCLLSNFNQDKVHVKEYCSVWIHQTTLLTAFYLSNDVYIVILDKPAVFHLSCKKADSGRQQINPPFGFLKLHRTFQATSNCFSLLGYFEGCSTRMPYCPILTFEDDSTYKHAKIGRAIEVQWVTCRGFILISIS